MNDAQKDYRVTIRLNFMIDLKGNCPEQAVARARDITKHTFKEFFTRAQCLDIDYGSCAKEIG